MILGDVMVPGKSYACDVCKYPWVSISNRLPDACPNRECRSREWNGKKTKRKPARGLAIEFPKPKKIKKGEDEDYEF